MLPLRIGRGLLCLANMAGGRFFVVSPGALPSPGVLMFVVSPGALPSPGVLNPFTRCSELTKPSPRHKAHPAARVSHQTAGNHRSSSGCQ